MQNEDQIEIIEEIDWKLRDEKEDNATVTFKLVDVYANEMATYITATINDIDRLLLVDISSYMTIIYENEQITPTYKLTYRGKSYDSEIKRGYMTVYGYHGPYDTENPNIQPYTVDIEMAHVNIDQ